MRPSISFHSPPRTTADTPRLRRDHKLVVPALEPAPPVNVLMGALAVGVPVALACSASQEVNVLFPKKTPTVSASVR